MKYPEELVDFRHAVKQGLGRDRGLFFPETIPELSDIEELLGMNFVERSKRIISAWLSDETGNEFVDTAISKAFNFPVPVKKVTERTSILELFHGPSLAFKDFGARFMAQSLSHFSDGKKITIITATSGDTGAAVASAFYEMPEIDVVILYPAGKVSPLQEKMFCTLGKNIKTLAVESDFDACQALVKQAFVDVDLNNSLNLNSANSINISRILAQICYYFEAVAQHRKIFDNLPVISVPSGNFGNLTAGMLAMAMGLPVKRFIAATNSNDTVVRYLKNKMWEPNKTVSTYSNAMDVSEPSNWPRVEEIMRKLQIPSDMLSGISITEPETLDSIVKLHDSGYLSEPHAAVASAALNKSLSSNESGVFLGTAHPAKFKEIVENALKIDIPLPKEIALVAEKNILSESIPADFKEFKKKLQTL